MCYANATLFYGLWVTTASLNFAAAAHKATRGPVLAIDLIVARRRVGKLEVEGQGARTTARELPEEVWHMVKQQLVNKAILQAELDAVKAMVCVSCSQNPPCAEDDAFYGRKRSTADRVWTFWGPPPYECDGCSQSMYDAQINDRSLTERWEVITLLTEYALALPSDYVWSESDSVADFDSLSAISLPLHSSNGASTTFPNAGITKRFHNPPDHTSVLDIDPQTFVVPADARRRFARLISVYHLDVVDRNNSIIFAGRQERDRLVGASREEGDAVTGSEAAPKRWAENEPRWMLCSQMSACT